MQMSLAQMYENLLGVLMHMEVRSRLQLLRWMLARKSAVQEKLCPGL